MKYSIQTHEGDEDWYDIATTIEHVYARVIRDNLREYVEHIRIIEWSYTSISIV